MAEAENLLKTVRMKVRNADDSVIRQSVQDSIVITVPIDSTLTVSGAAADAMATGQAIVAKASESDVKSQLSVNGRTGGGSWAIMVNGDNIPAQSDNDSESVADALTRIDGAVGAEATARQQEDTALDGRLDVLEARPGLAVQIDFTVAGALDPITDERFTADHYLAGVVWLDDQGNVTGDVLADLTWTTAAGSLTVVIDQVWAAGSVILTFGYREDATPEEVGS